MASAKAKDLVSSNPVVVFSKSYCPYCVSVKKLLTELGSTFKAIELDQESEFSPFCLDLRYMCMYMLIGD
ncbi:putative thioredoxin-disulfide reductase [Helianthus debilis subsp. tardiflorus]